MVETGPPVGWRSSLSSCRGSRLNPSAQMARAMGARPWGRATGERCDLSVFGCLFVSHRVALPLVFVGFVCRMSWQARVGRSCRRTRPVWPAGPEKRATSIVQHRLDLGRRLSQRDVGRGRIRRPSERKTLPQHHAFGSTIPERFLRSSSVGRASMASARAGEVVRLGRIVCRGWR